MGNLQHSGEQECTASRLWLLGGIDQTPKSISFVIIDFQLFRLANC